MQNKHIHHYNGYAVQPSAHRLPDGSFSSNLLLERADSARTEGRYQFYSLDYFTERRTGIAALGTLGTSLGRHARLSAS